MCAYVGMDDAQGAVLRASWSVLGAHLDAVIERFYSRILADEGATAVLQDAAQVERLKGTLRQWLRELFEGPWDDAYAERRRRIGRRHVEVGLPSRYMFLAISAMRSDLCELANRYMPADEAMRCAGALQRITELDLALMTGTYMQSREDVQMSELRELVFRQLPARVLVIGADDRVWSSTPLVDQIAGGRPTGARVDEALPAELATAFGLGRMLAEAGRTRRPQRRERVTVERDGRHSTWSVEVVPLDHPGARALVHLEDLTPVLDAEARLQRQEALARIGALSSAVAHELRNPLAGISGAVQVLLRSMPSTDGRHDVLRAILDQTRRLDTLVTDLLHFARPANARLSRIDLRALVTSTVDLARSDRVAAQIVVEGAGTALADPNLVTQIVLNLVQNATQAADPPPVVRVVVAPARVTVSDAGPGVPEALREQIFEPFFTTRTRGTGLGLAISARAALAMGGRLSLAPHGPLAGATFVLELQAE